MSNQTETNSYWSTFLFMCMVILFSPFIVSAFVVSWKISLTVMLCFFAFESYLCKKKREREKEQDFYVYKRDLTDKEKVELIRRKLQS